MGMIGVDVCGRREGRTAEYARVAMHQWLKSFPEQWLQRP